MSSSLLRALLPLAVLAVAVPARADTQAELAEGCKKLVGFTISGRAKLDTNCKAWSEVDWGVETSPQGEIKWWQYEYGDLLKRRDDYWNKELPQQYDPYKKKKVISETKTSSLWVQRFNTFFGESIVTAALIRMPDGTPVVRFVKVLEKRSSGLLTRVKVDFPKQDLMTPEEVAAWLAQPRREKLETKHQAPDRDINYSMLLPSRALDSLKGRPGSGKSELRQFVSATWTGKDAALDVLVRRSGVEVSKDKAAAARDQLVAEAIKDVPNIDKRERLSGTSTTALFTERWKMSDSTGMVKTQFVVVGAYLRDKTTSATPIKAEPFTISAWCREDKMPLDSCTRILDSFAIHNTTLDPATLPGNSYASSSSPPSTSSSPPSSTTSSTPSTPSSAVYAFAENFFRLGLEKFKNRHGMSCAMIDSTHSHSISLVMTDSSVNHAFFAISDVEITGSVILAPSGKQLAMTQFGSSSLAAKTGMSIVHVSGKSEEQKVARLDVSTTSAEPHKVCLDVLIGAR